MHENTRAKSCCSVVYSL